MSAVEIKRATRTPRGSALATFGVIVILLAAAIVGWLISVDRISNPTDVTLVVLALIVGVACFFNPCALPVFPVLMANIYASGQADMGRPERIRLAFSGAAGVAVFMALLGILLYFFGESMKDLMIGVPYRTVRVIAGVALLAGAVFVFLKRGLNVPFLSQWFKPNPEQPARTLFGYGLVYTILGLGCTAPILFGFVVANAAFAGVEAFSAFVIAGLVMTALMFATIYFVRSQTRLGGAWMARMHRGTAIVFVLVGSFMVLEALFPNVFNPILHPWLR